LRILVTNDDGINAKGLWALVKALKGFAEVVVVAPDREQSAVGTSVTLHSPLRVTPITPPIDGVKAYSVEGTPSDCVILAFGNLIDGGVDMVVSGINEGPNLGDDVFISGTVGAALQAYLKGLPSIAISIATPEALSFDAATRLVVLLVQMLRAGALPREVLLNVNLPNLPLDKIQGLEITRLGGRGHQDKVREVHDGKRKRYWLVRGEPSQAGEKGTDVWALREGRISITPLRSDLTNSSLFPALENSCSSLFDALHLEKEVEGFSFLFYRTRDTG